MRTASLRPSAVWPSHQEDTSMRRYPGSRWARSMVALLCLTVGLTLVPATTAVAITPAECDARANDTPAKLIECIQTADLWNHMVAFQAIADAHPGPDGMPSRNSGEPGYKASADYVAAKMTAAGYDVTLQPYTFDYYAYTGLPALTENSPTARTYGLLDDW